MRQAAFLCALFLCALTPAALAQRPREQPHTTRKIEVRVPDCRKLQEVIRVVVNGSEDSPVRAKEAEPGVFRGNAPKTFDAAHSIGSLRFGSGGRTACKESRPEREPEDRNQWIAVYAFDCLDEPTWKSLIVGANAGTIPITAVRFMPAGKDSVDCKDRWAQKGEANLSDVAPASERIYLHFAEPPEGLSHEFYHLYIENGRAGPKAIVARGTTMSTAEIGAAWSARSRNAANEAKILELGLGKTFKSATLKKVE